MTEKLPPDPLTREAERVRDQWRYSEYGDRTLRLAAQQTANLLERLTAKVRELEQEKRDNAGAILLLISQRDKSEATRTALEGALKAKSEDWRRKANRYEADGQEQARDAGVGVVHPAEWEASRLRDCADELDALLSAPAATGSAVTGDDASREAAKRMFVRGPSPTPHRVRPSGSTVTLAEYNMALAEADELRQRLMVAERHHCSGCGHTWNGPSAGVTLCGDCWRKGQAVVHGPAQGEEPR